MGILPLQFLEGERADNLGIIGNEIFSIEGIEEILSPGQDVFLLIEGVGGASRRVKVRSRLDTQLEIDYFQQGGILPIVLRHSLSS